MPFEALLLQRLARIPTGRRQAWLRGLLVQGFLDECRLRREVDGEGNVAPRATKSGQSTLFASWLAERSPAQAPPSVAKVDPVDRPDPISVATKNKPFAHLRKVIG